MIRISAIFAFCVVLAGCVQSYVFTGATLVQHDKLRVTLSPMFVTENAAVENEYGRPLSPGMEATGILVEINTTGAAKVSNFTATYSFDGRNLGDIKIVSHRLYAERFQAYLLPEAVLKPRKGDVHVAYRPMPQGEYRVTLNFEQAGVLETMVLAFQYKHNVSRSGPLKTWQD